MHIWYANTLCKSSKHNRHAYLEYLLYIPDIHIQFAFQIDMHVRYTSPMRISDKHICFRSCGFSIGLVVVSNIMESLHARPLVKRAWICSVIIRHVLRKTSTSWRRHRTTCADWLSSDNWISKLYHSLEIFQVRFFVRSFGLMCFSREVARRQNITLLWQITMNIATSRVKRFYTLLDTNDRNASPLRVAYTTAWNRKAWSIQDGTQRTLCDQKDGLWSSPRQKQRGLRSRIT